MIDTDRDIVFACSACSRATRSPGTPVNVCDDCGGRVTLRYADRVDHVDGVGGDGTGAATASDGGSPGA
jgi:rRNA maturation endonuclease Nob1